MVAIIKKKAKKRKYLTLQTDGKLKEVFEENYVSSYDMIKSNVEGTIEGVSFISIFNERGIKLFVNENGLLLDLLPIIVVRNGDEVVYVLHGNIFFARVNNEGDILPLSDDDCDFIKKVFDRKMIPFMYRNICTNNKASNKVFVIQL